MRLAQRPQERRMREMAVWHEWPEAPRPFETKRRVNVGTAERWLSLAGGAAIAAWGISRRSLPGWLMAAAGGYMVYRGMSGHCHGYDAMGINTASDGIAEPADYYERGIHITKAVTINAPADRLYEFWRDLTNLPRVMTHLKRVDVLDEKRSHWVVEAPFGRTVEWDAEIINDERNELIAWRSLQDAEVHNAGSVRFIPMPGDRGTQVRVTIEYIPTAGRLGKLIASVFGDSPEQQVQEDLRHFKQILEAGEIPTTEGQPRGTCTQARS